MGYTVWFSDNSIIEFHDVTDHRRMWRHISKHCKFANTRVLNVERVN